MYKYIDLTVEVFEEYFETSFFWVGESFGIQSWTFIGRPKSDGCKCEGRASQKFSLCGGHK